MSADKNQPINQPTNKPTNKSVRIGPGRRTSVSCHENTSMMNVCPFCFPSRNIKPYMRKLIILLTEASSKTPVCVMHREEECGRGDGNVTYCLFRAALIFLKDRSLLRFQPWPPVHDEDKKCQERKWGNVRPLFALATMGGSWPLTTVSCICVRAPRPPPAATYVVHMWVDNAGEYIWISRRDLSKLLHEVLHFRFNLLRSKMTFDGKVTTMRPPLCLPLSLAA